ncbi:MAG: hypothetical protein DHS20C18_39300 [Saprospiraceae bacterium]|nr:MAG: hypothetical protein DHS20C18_39300 [Saprospiraceae bacterium]
MGYGAVPAELEAALSQNPSQLVDNLIDEAVNLPLPEPPEWANWTINEYDDFFAERQPQFVEWVVKWVKDMLSNGFREKVSLFWHNHFVTKVETYLCPSHTYQYHTLLQQYALGNFRDFVYDMGKSPAMLVFLNGVQSTNIEPNENYARELYELFTLGQDNGYTQNDIVATARALTGWVGYTTYCDGINYVPFFHDNGIKTIFGQTGTWGYDDVNELLFTHRADQVATHICTKIYENFVHPEANEDIVAEMATTFKNNNWELAPVFRQLFKSEHFFDDYIMGTQVKSPTDFFLSFIREGDFSHPDEIMEAVTYFIYSLGQELFSPTDVSGWPGNRNWIDSTALTGRWKTMDAYLLYLYQNFPEELRQFALNLSNQSNDPALITQVIADYFLPNGFYSPEIYDRATTALKWEVPQNYYDEGSWNLYWETAPLQVAVLMQYICRQPEFQLQ